MSQSEKAKERIRLIEERLARLRSEKERLEARVSQVERKRITRRKIVIGGTVLAALEHEGVPPMRTEAELKRWLEARLTRPHHGAQPARYLQLAGNGVDQDGNSVRYRTADRRMITERDSQNVMAHVITHEAQPSRTDAPGGASLDALPRCFRITRAQERDSRE